MPDRKPMFGDIPARWPSEGHSSRIIVPRFRAVLSRRTRSAGSADVGRQVLIGRDEFFPACLDVVGFTASEVRGEVFGVDLPAGSEEGDLVQGDALDLNDQGGLGGVGGQ